MSNDTIGPLPSDPSIILYTNLDHVPLRMLQIKFGQNPLVFEGADTFFIAKFERNLLVFEGAETFYSCMHQLTLLGPAPQAPGGPHLFYIQT